MGIAIPQPQAATRSESPHIRAVWRIVLAFAIIGAFPSSLWIFKDFPGPDVHIEDWDRLFLVIGTFLGPLMLILFTGFPWFVIGTIPVLGVALAIAFPRSVIAQAVGYLGVFLWILLGTFVMCIGF